MNHLTKVALISNPRICERVKQSIVVHTHRVWRPQERCLERYTCLPRKRYERFTPHGGFRKAQIKILILFLSLSSAFPIKDKYCGNSDSTVQQMATTSNGSLAPDQLVQDCLRDVHGYQVLVAYGIRSDGLWIRAIICPLH